MTLTETELRERASSFGQGHLFRFWENLSPERKENLLKQLRAVDFELVKEHAALLMDPPATESVDLDLAPPVLFPLERSSAQSVEATQAEEEGASMIAAGDLAFLLVAGGQASRLGYDGPKGAFPVGPVSDRSLFELHARRLRAAEARHCVCVPWYVMTSPANDQATRYFFEQNDSFGLDPEQIAFFSQAMIPALDLEGRIMMSAKDSLFLAPNGHGGTLAALESSGCLADARARGIKTFSYFQVDNPLVRPADTLFFGLHAQAGARMSSKVVSKCNADEKVGVIGKVDDKLGCIEYSDLPRGLREARDAEQRLLFRAGNIAAHLLELDFVEELTRERLELPWHVARKSMLCVDDSGEMVSRDGAKFETFIFDALGRSPDSVTLEVKRELEFSPVKNAQGDDSPASARRDLCQLFAGWVQETGGTLPDPGGDGLVPVEVCPLVAEDAAEFAAAKPLAPNVREAGHLYDRMT
ncbi:MAG: UDP-N-acetylglucosamine/UDP-N-acetylgalactosamine diphosphorylase [Planctomycetota bacterium]